MSHPSRSTTKARSLAGTDLSMERWLVMQVGTEFGICQGQTWVNCQSPLDMEFSWDIYWLTITHWVIYHFLFLDGHQCIFHRDLYTHDVWILIMDGYTSFTPCFYHGTHELSMRFDRDPYTIIIIIIVIVIIYIYILYTPLVLKHGNGKSSL